MEKDRFIFKQAIEQNVLFAEEEESKTSVKALVFYSGVHTNSWGTEREFTRQDVTTYANNSNVMLLGGEKIKLFKDHYYSTDSVIGFVDRFRVEEISEESLPNPNQKDLIGELGVYADITILGEENVARYKDKRIKEVSAGIDLQKNCFYEVSVVPFPALAGASLFAKGGHMTTNKTEDTAQFTAEQFQELKDQLEKTTAKLAAVEQEKQVAVVFGDLRIAANNLKDAGKMTPAAYNYLFGKNEQEQLSAFAAEGGAAKLEAIAFHLEMVEKFGQSIVATEELSKSVEVEPSNFSAPINSDEIARRAALLAQNSISYKGGK